MTSVISSSTWRKPLISRSGEVLAPFPTALKPTPGYRYDYFADSQTLILRMPGDLHECTLACIWRLLDRKITKLYEDHGCENPFESLGNKEVKFVGSNDCMIPDAAMYDSKDRSLPVLVIEIGITQTAKTLKKKADKYIRLGNGSIRYVYTLQVRKGSGEISLTKRTPERDEQNTIHSATTRQVCCSLPQHSLIWWYFLINLATQQIRTADKKVGSGAGLEISMKEIMPKELSTSPIAQKTVVISVQEIYDIVEAAEHLEADEKRKTAEKAGAAKKGEVPEPRFLPVPEGPIPAESDSASEACTDHESDVDYKPPWKPRGKPRDGGTPPPKD